MNMKKEITVEDVIKLIETARDKTKSDDVSVALYLLLDDIKNWGKMKGTGRLLKYVINA